MASAAVKRDILSGKVAWRCWKMAEESGMILSPCCSTGNCMQVSHVAGVGSGAANIIENWITIQKTGGIHISD